MIAVGSVKRSIEVGPLVDGLSAADDSAIEFKGGTVGVATAVGIDHNGSADRLLSDTDRRYTPV